MSNGVTTETEMSELSFSHDGEWAFVGRLAVYPRPDGTFSIGRISGARDYRDIETGFANMEAAIDQAVWRADNPTVN